MVNAIPVLHMNFLFDGDQVDYTWHEGGVLAEVRSRSFVKRTANTVANLMMINQMIQADIRAKVAFTRVPPTMENWPTCSIYIGTLVYGERFEQVAGPSLRMCVAGVLASLLFEFEAFVRLRMEDPEMLGPDPFVKEPNPEEVLHLVQQLFCRAPTPAEMDEIMLLLGKPNVRDKASSGVDVVDEARNCAR